MIILDASALLAVVLDERGQERMGALLETQDCRMSAVNLVEVHQRMFELDNDIIATRDLLAGLEVGVLPFDDALAELAAALRPRTRRLGLSLADRACIATGIHHDAAIFTADRAWGELGLDDADIRLVR